MEQHIVTGSALGRKLTRYVVLLSLVAMLVSTVVQLYLAYRHHMREISVTFDQIEGSYVKSLVDNVWVYNDKQIIIQLNGMLNLHGIEYVHVNIGGQIAWSSGVITSGSTIEKTLELIYQEGNRREPIGTLTVVAGRDQAYSEVFAGARVALLSSVFTVFIVAGCILLVFRSLVTRHMTKVANFVATIDLNQKSGTLSLDRQSPPDKKADELDHVVDAINSMTDNVSKSYSALQHEIAERSKIANELQVSNKDLEKVNKAFVGRELKMAELKKEIEELKKNK